MVTELIEFKLRNDFTNEQLTQEAEMVVEHFHKKQDGFIDMELISDTNNQQWEMILHYESMEDIEKVKENVPKSEALKKFSKLVEPDTLKVSFYEQLGKWSYCV